MNSFTGVQIEVVARSIARANLIWSMGQQGVAAINPKLLHETFDKMWMGTTPHDVAVRDAARWIAQAVLHDRAVIQALKE